MGGGIWLCGETKRGDFQWVFDFARTANFSHTSDILLSRRLNDTLEALKPDIRFAPATSRVQPFSSIIFQIIPFNFDLSDLLS